MANESEESVKDENVDQSGKAGQEPERNARAPSEKKAPGREINVGYVILDGAFDVGGAHYRHERSRLSPADAEHTAPSSKKH